MSTVWETFLNNDQYCVNYMYNIIAHNAGNVIFGDDKVVSIDVHTTKRLGDGPDHVYRFFPNGTVDKGTEVETPEPDVDPVAREAAVTLVMNLVKSLEYASTSNDIAATAQQDADPLGIEQHSFAHNYLASHAQAIADVLRKVPDLL